MAWRDRLTQASFRGVPFFVESHELVGGRKTIVFDYPLRDVPFVEDLGRRTREYAVDAYVVGPDYMDARDGLLDALEQSGPGTLVHPYLGTRVVAVSPGGFRVTESVADGGMARISISFVETEPKAFAPYVAPVPGLIVGKRVDVAYTALNANFIEQYQTRVPPSAPGVSSRSLPAFSFTRVAGIIQSASASLNKYLSPVVKGTQELAALRTGVNSLVFDATSLVRDPASLVGRLTDVFRSFSSIFNTPRMGVDALAQAYSFDAPDRPVTTTATRAIEQSNYDLTLSLVQTMIAIESAQAAADAAVSTPVGYDSYDEAVKVRDRVLGQLEEQADQAPNDWVYSVLVQLAADVALAVPGEANALPRLSRYTPITTTAALALSFRLYGDLSRTEDLIARNRVRHPGFVRGGRELQVLSNA